jgi:hypothetical protein
MTGAGATTTGAGVSTGSESPPADAIPATIAKGAANMLVRANFDVIVIVVSVFSVVVQGTHDSSFAVFNQAHAAVTAIGQNWRSAALGVGQNWPIF